MLRESVALAGLPWRGRSQGDSERKSGLPGAEPRLCALAWDRAGEPGNAPRRKEGEEGEPWPCTRGGAAAGNPKPLPRAAFWMDELRSTLYLLFLNKSL